ncbi:hypothetical protein [Trueperella pyogenes]|uniref:hypothetical protein n=1 Tax=Trueperella pyogenes TaxID=1661 RepID=UPI0006B244EA|nr:hypothetical protein [Trueperella pyogenes]ALD73826.1 hypothetical protein AN946_05290 [Trueperella pyogenes]MCI7690371.1 hypothetical protein [Trueperella pyogenes]
MMELEHFDTTLRTELAGNAAGVHAKAVSLIDSELKVKLARAYADIRERDAVISALSARIEDLEEQVANSEPPHEEPAPVSRRQLLAQVKHNLPEPLRTLLRPAYRLAKKVVGRG